MTAPGNPLLETMAQAMTDSDIAEMGVCGDPEYYDRQARAVLAALEQAGHIKWGLFRKTDPLDALAFEGRNQFPTKEDAQKYITHGFLPHMHDILEPRSRIAGPWERAE